MAILIISPKKTTSVSRKEAGNAFLEKTFNRADSALQCKLIMASFRYSGNFENPFRLPAEAFTAPLKKKKISSPLNKLKLSLKGVLLKEKPLAILEDENGKTYICGTGEKIQEEIVASIEENRVTLSGSGGRYTLTVKE